MQLTQLQRAQRRASRINRKLRERYPLFAEQWATTAAEQLPEIERLDRITTRYLARLEEGSREMEERAAELRSQVAYLVTPEELAELDQRRGIYPESPVYAADFWRRTLAELGGGN